MYKQITNIKMNNSGEMSFDDINLLLTEMLRSIHLPKAISGLFGR